MFLGEGGMGWVGGAVDTLPPCRGGEEALSSLAGVEPEGRR